MNETASIFFFFFWGSNVCYVSAIHITSTSIMFRFLTKVSIILAKLIEKYIWKTINNWKKYRLSVYLVGRNRKRKEDWKWKRAKKKVNFNFICLAWHKIISFYLIFFLISFPFLSFLQTKHIIKTLVRLFEPIKLIFKLIS